MTEISLYLKPLLFNSLILNSISEAEESSSAYIMQTISPFIPSEKCFNVSEIEPTFISSKSLESSRPKAISMSPLADCIDLSVFKIRSGES